MGIFDGLSGIVDKVDGFATKIGDISGSIENGIANVNNVLAGFDIQDKTSRAVNVTGFFSEPIPQFEVLREKAAKVADRVFGGFTGPVGKGGSSSSAVGPLFTEEQLLNNRAIARANTRARLIERGQALTENQLRELEARGLSLMDLLKLSERSLPDPLMLQSTIERRPITLAILAAAGIGILIFALR